MTLADSVIHLPDSSAPLQILLNSGASAGGLGLVEMQFAPGGSGPPLHVHPTHGEGFYVLAGELTFQLGDEIVTGGPGLWVYAPKNTPHTLANLSKHEARLLCVFSPAGFERRFERLIAEQAGIPFTVEPSPAERETRAVGPPLSAPDQA